MTVVSTSDKTKALEISAVILTAVAKFLFMDYLNWKLPFIIITIIFWVCYIIYRSKRNPGITKYWGFRSDNFSQVIKIILPFAIAAFIILICIGIFQHTIKITWHILPILLLYPLWGIIQQFLLIALTAGNLYDYKNVKIPKVFIIIITSSLFGLIHYPFVWLMIGTFILAIFYSLIYLRQRNIYALGIFHGWLGAFIFYTVVNRDPFTETFGRILNI
jgi:uncharacterized protein